MPSNMALSPSTKLIISPCGSSTFCPTSLAPVAKANALAATMPARRPVNGAGPMPTTISSRSAGVSPASSTARAILTCSFSTWVRESVSTMGSRPTMPTVEPNEVSITNVQPMNPPSRKASRECTSRSLWAHGLLQVERGPSLADWDECDGTSAVAGEFAV